jgi:hypothetical protein
VCDEKPPSVSSKPRARAAFYRDAKELISLFKSMIYDSRFEMRNVIFSYDGFLLLRSISFPILRKLIFCL